MIADAVGGFVLDASALVELGAGPGTYATTWADFMASRGVVLLVPAAVLAEAWQEIRRTGPAHVDQMRDLLTSPMILVEVLDWESAERAGELTEGRDLVPDVPAAQVAVCARARGWACVSAAPDRVRTVDPSRTVETLPGKS